MARMYRAGTAFVEVVPSFKNMQKDIAKALRKDLKSALSDKDAYSELDKNIQETFKSALGKAHAEVNKDVQKMVKDVDSTVTKGATVSAKNVKKAVEKELGGGWHGEQMRKVGKDLKKVLGEDTLKSLSAEHSKMRAKIQQDIDLLSTSFTKSGERDAREVERAYLRLKKAMDKLQGLENAGMSNKGVNNVREAGNLLNKGSDRLVGGLTEAQIAEQNRLNRKAESEAARHARKQNSITDAANREARRIDNEERKRQQMNDAKDAARARERHRNLYETQYRNTRDLASVGPGMGGKEEKLTAKRDASLATFQNRVQGVINKLSELNNAQPHVRINTGGALNDLAKLQNQLYAYEETRPEAEVGLIGDEDVERELRALRTYAERTLRDIDFDVELDDEGAKAALNEFKAQAEAMQDIEVGVNAEVNRAEYEKVRAQIAKLGEDTEHVQIRLNSDGVYDDVVAIDTAIESIRDKKVGVDITEREALAEIATIQAGLAAIDEDKDVEITIDYDRTALPEFHREADLARAKMRRLSRAIKDVNVSMSESTQAFRIFTPMLTAVAFAGAPAVSALGGVVAGLGGIASFAPGAVAGLSPLMFAFAGLEDAAKKYEKAQEALAIPKKDLTDAQKESIAKWEAEKDVIGEATVNWIEYTDTLKTEIAAVQKGAREGLFPGLQASLETIMDRYAKPFTGFLKDSGERLGTLAQIWSNELTTDESAEWFARIGRDSEIYISALGGWVSNTVEGLGHLTDAFRPFAREFSDWLVNSSERFSSWSEGLVGDDRLLEFFDSVRATLPGIGDLLKNVGEFFVNVTIAVEPFTLAILDAVNAGLDFVNAMDPKVLGAILGAVGGLTGGLMLLSGVMAGVGALSAVVGAIGGSWFTQLAGGLALFVAVSATALGATSALGAETTLLGGAAVTLGSSLEGVSGLGKAFYGLLGDLLDAVEPLLPVVAELISDVLGLGVALGTGLINTLSGVVGLVGEAVEWFTKLPVGLQETALVAGAGALAFGKMKSGLELAIPLLTSGVDSLKLWGMYGKDSLKAAGDAVTGFKFGMEGAVQMMGAEGGIMYGLKGMKSGLGGVKNAAAEAWGALGAAGRTTVVITAVVTALVAMKAASDAVNFEPAVKETEQFDAAIKGMSGSTRAAKRNLDELFSPEEGGDQLGSWAVEGIDGIASAMEYMNERTKGAGASLNELDSEFQTLFGLFGDTEWDVIQGQLAGMDDSLAGMVSTDFETAANGYRELAETAAEAGVGAEELNEHFDSYKGKLEATALALGGVKLTSQEYTEWMAGHVPQAIQDAADSEQYHKEKLDGVTSATQAAAEQSERLVRATNEMQNAFDQSMDSAVIIEEAMGVLDESLAAGKNSFDRSTEAGKANSDAIRDIRDESLKKAEADAITKGSTEGMSDALWSNYDALVATLTQMTGNKDEAHRLANKYYQIPEDVRTKAEFNNEYANAQVDVTDQKIEDLDGEEAEPEVKAKTKGANDDIDDTADKLHNLDEKGDITVWVRIKRWWDDLWGDDGKPKKTKKGASNPDRLHNANGNLLEAYANGGLRPMNPVAQMVKPNTWRVVGDRMKDDEAYIPLDGSKRSWSILMETIQRMPDAQAFHDGGIAQFAAGAVASSASPAPAAPKAGEEQVGDLTAVTEAFQVLAAQLGESWSTLLTSMLAQANQFYIDLLAVALGQNAIVLATQQAHNTTALTAEQAHLAAMLAATQANFGARLSARYSFNSTDSSSNSGHLSSLSSTNSAWRSNQLSATTAYLESRLARFRSGDTSLRTHWSGHWSGMSDIAADFRRREGDRFDSFLNGTMISTVDKFGSTIKSEWSSIWHSLVSSATSIFSALPTDVGNILSSTSGKMNTHIVDPYNKVVKDLDLKKDLKISRFPVQKYADGGVMQGYTPGRDVHKFYSDTGGILELSGGEPVMRPEFGAVVGTQWVDQANAAARNGGVRGVQKFLGHQAYADGGIFDGGHQALADGGQIKKDRKGIIQLGRVLQSLGVRVSEHSAFGGNSGGHARNSWHNRDGALDLNTAPGTSAKEMADFDRIMPMLYKLGWGTIWRYPNHYGHAHVDIGNRSLGSFNRNPSTSGDLWEKLLSMKVGPATGGGSSVDFFDLQGEMEGWIGKAKKAAGSGALPELMTGAGDKIFTALAKEKADQFIETAAFGGAGNYSSVADGPIKQMAKDMLEARGWGDQFGTLNRLLNKESGWNPRAQNPKSTAYGMFQFLNGTWDDVGGTKTSDPRKQLEYGLDYIAQRYGDVRGAMAHHRRHNWYADGGMVDLSPEVLLRDNGGPLPMGYSVVHNNLGHEETIIPKTVDDVASTFERLEQVSTGDAGVTVKDSVFRGDPREVATELHRQARIQKIGMAVKF